MCGIIGIFNNKNNEAVKQVKIGLKIIKDRGRDYYGIANKKDIDYKKDINKLKIYQSRNCIGHCLHSIVSFNPQPFFNKRTGSKFITNCEIYNWKKLNTKYKLKAKNDSEVLFRLIEKKAKSANKLKKLLQEEIDGVFAFAYWNKNKLYLARDILGVKPLCFSVSSSSFAFSSEMKVLEELNYKNNQELNPRKILVYNLKNKKAKQYNRSFFKITPEIKKSKQEIIKKVEGLIINAVSKRIPDKQFGILFSGGVDSTFIALICKKLGLNPTLYTAALDYKGMKTPEDLIWAKKAAKKLKLKLKINMIKLNDVEKYIKKVIPLIEDANVVKVGVGLTFYAACELAKKDNIKVIFSGLGSEEIFAGYERHKIAAETEKAIGKRYINKECISGLLKMYERDLYRDDIITMNNNLELRLPFLDKKLVDYSLKIPAKFKINIQNKNNNKIQNKIILRETAEYLGLDKELAQRKKLAAQYGSKFHKAIAKLTKMNGFKLKSEYLKQFYKQGRQGNLKLGVLFSSGKDSNYALYVIKKQNYDIGCLITLKSLNPASYMFHTPNIDLVRLQAEALGGIPLIEQETKGEKEKELKDLEKAIKKAKQKYNLDGIATGALYSTYQRDRIEKICDKLGLKVFSPLWHIDQELEMRQLIRKGFKVILSSIQAEGLNSSWLGRVLTEKDVDKLAGLNKRISLNIAGEGGEYESLVVDSPLFKKKIKIINSEIVEEKKNTAFFVVKKAKLVGK